MPNPKTARVLLPGAARTASAASPVQQDEFYIAARFYLTITAASGSGGLKVVVRGYDRVAGSGSAQGASSPAQTYTGAAVALSTGGTPVTATGTYVYEFTPWGGTARGNIEQVTQMAMPYLWDAQIIAGDGSSYTYSLSVELAGR